jgi:hypothetical protein
MPVLFSIYPLLASCSQNPNRSSEEIVRVSLNGVAEPLFERVNSVNLSVSSPEGGGVFDTSFTLDPSSGNISSFNLYLGTGDNFIFRAWSYSQNRQPLYRAVEAIDINGDITPTVILQLTQSGFRSSSNVKILRDELPWDSYGMDSTLAEIGLAAGGQFSVYSSSELASMELIPDTDLLIISNDQPQRFYDNLSLYIERVTAFVATGGTVLWEVCDLAWNYGSYSAAGIDSFPGGISHRTSYDIINIISDRDLYLIGGLEDTLNGIYASNKYFTNIPDSAIVYTENSDGDPTLMGLKFGDGIIFYSGQPLEYNFDRRNDYNMGFLLPRIISFLLGISWEDPSLHAPGRVLHSRPENRQFTNR